MSDDELYKRLMDPPDTPLGNLMIRVGAMMADAEAMNDSLRQIGQDLISLDAIARPQEPPERGE